MQDILFNQNNDFFMTKYLNIQITVNINTNGKNKCKMYNDKCEEYVAIYRYKNYEIMGFR